MNARVHTTRCARISPGPAGFNSGKNAGNTPDPVGAQAGQQTRGIALDKASALLQLSRAADQMGNGAMKAGTIPTGIRASAITATMKSRVERDVVGASISGCVLAQAGRRARCPGRSTPTIGPSRRRS